MSRKPKADPRIELIEMQTPFQGYFRIDRYRLKHRRFDGGWSGEINREVFERGQAASVLPYDPLSDTVILIEQFRIGAYAAGLDPWLCEVVAGVVESGEDPAGVAGREAVEEAGCNIVSLVPIGKVLLSPGGCSEILHMYCGRVDSRGLGGLHGLDDEDEDIRAFTLPRQEALRRLADGAFVSAPAIMSLQWLALNRERLLQQWLP